MMEIKKGTHEDYKTELFVPVMKGENGKYMAVLSDNSTDRDDESISKGCIESLGNDNKYLAALCNHKNDVFMQVAEWTNMGCKEVDGFTALVAEPKFYTSNPNAKIIKGMLDEGAKIGISIGAIVKNYDEINGKRMFTELELLEASFVAIPSNRHGRAMAVAKSFNKNPEVMKVEKEFTQKDIDSAIETKTAELKEEFKKQLVEKDSEILSLTEKLKKSEDEVKEVKEEVESVKEKSEEKEAAMKAEIEKEKKSALEKQNFAAPNQESNEQTEDVAKAFKDGKIPVMNMQ